MEEEKILQQPSDRRLGDNNTLPPGPPGVEMEGVDFDGKSTTSKASVVEKENSASDRTSRRRSPSGSPPPRKRKSPSRNRRSPSPPTRSRGRRSPSPRRNRYRGYSPDRRPRFGGRRSPDRRRSPIRRGGGGRDRYRGRGRSSSRSISRSPTPPPRRGGAGRWSPKKKPNSPPQQQQPPPVMPRQLSQPPPTTNQPPPQYGVMAPPPPQLYGGDAYGPPPGYNQYGVPPPQTGFVQPNDAYVAMQTQGAGFNTAYPPPGAWGVDAYAQQQWMPPPAQIQQMPPPPQQQQPPPLVVPAAAQQPVPTNVPPPSTVPPVVAVNKHTSVPDEAPGTVDANPQHDAVAQEAENQRDELKKQRTSYLKKTSILKKELKMLKEQRKDLHSGGAPASPTTKGFIDENEKLQSQIQKKLSTIENVIDMLTGIIGEENLDKDDEALEDDDVLKEAALSSLQKPHGERGQSIQAAATVAVQQKKKTRSSSSSSSESSSGTSSSSTSESSSSETETPHNKEDEDDDSSPERLKKKVIESMKNKEKEISKAKQEQRGPSKKERFNYVFYDPEMHWCQTCNVFPKTAKDFLNHLHTKNHMDRESIETPWHTDMVTDQFPTYENAPTKRTPIRGLTFFVPATSWFCKLCNIWMGDLHCASTHLKSQLHANRYNAFLEENPHYEVNWLADRQIALNEQKSTPLPQQITSVSTTAAERKKLKKEDDKNSKKRKKKSDKKQKKKKKKSNKKRKKESDSSSSTSSESSSSTDSDEPKKKKSSFNAEVKDNLENPNPAVSIRLSMRKQETVKTEDSDVPPPPPPMKIKQPSPTPAALAAGKWTVVQEGVKNKEGEKVTDADDSIIQQWNTVQPVISESEKKLLEQLKGKLKNKSKDEPPTKSSTVARADNEKENRDREREREKERERDKDKEREKTERDSRSERDRGTRDRERDSARGREDRDRRTTRRSRTRSPTRSRSRGRDYRRNVRRSRSRGRMSPRGWRGNRNRRDRSRSRSLRRRSRSPYDRRRRNSRSRSRSTSRGGARVEKPVVRPAEFRPRVPEKDKEKDKKSSESKDKKDKPKQKSSSSTAPSTNSTGKKLPFIGKMPVFKKQATGAPGENEKRPEDLQQGLSQQQAGGYMYTMDASNAFGRPPAPTAAQIQMAMMEDAYGNAPPFHPDAGMMVDYDDLMPDPVQFVNIMGQAPPPPPPQTTEDDKDILPPGIDMEESEEFVPKPITEGPPPGKGPLPKDLEDALNIIFPGEKKPGEESDTEEGDLEKLKAKGETQIINDEAVIKPEELAREGIHLVTFEETSQLGLEEASQMSMNEPLQFNRPPSNPPTMNISISANDMDIEDVNSQNNLDLNIATIVPPPPPETYSPKPPPLDEEEAIVMPKSPPSMQQNLTYENEEPLSTEVIPPNIPMPTEDMLLPDAEINNSVEQAIAKQEDLEGVAEEQIEKQNIEENIVIEEQFIHHTNDIDLADIPQPPPSPTESEKNRRQEELDDLAMLGIDADDMAAQCISSEI